MSDSAVRRLWPLAVGVVLGIVVGVLVSLLGSTTRKAEAKVLVSSPGGVEAVRPQLPNLRELATSGVVAGNVRSTLRLPESTEEVRQHLDASVRSASDVIAVSYSDKSGERARQIAQEAATVFAQLVGTRFGTANPSLQAAVLDSAHVLGARNRHFVRNALIGALVGLLLGAVAFFVLAGSKRAALVSAADEDLQRREEALEERVRGMTARERALAVQAGRLAGLEHALEERERALVETQPPPEPEPEREPEPEPEPESAPELAAPPALPVRPGAWNVDELERFVEGRPDAPREQQEEWRSYLYFLRQHAAADGSLPRQFDGLITDVFGGVMGSPQT